jgi:hypothetical protein
VGGWGSNGAERIESSAHVKIRGTFSPKETILTAAMSMGPNRPPSRSPREMRRDKTQPARPALVCMVEDMPKAPGGRFCWDDALGKSMT